MNIQPSIEAWASRYPRRFKISHCTAGTLGSLCASPDTKGTSLVTHGRKSPADVPIILTIWVADDANYAFAVHTHEDNHLSPDELPLDDMNAGTENALAAVLDRAVSAFCASHGFTKDQLAAEDGSH